MANRRAGLLEVKVNGEIYDAKGSFTYNLGANKRTTIVGADRVHGYSELPQAPFIEGELTDDSTLDVKTLLNVDDATVTLTLANGKVVLLRDAWYAADGDIQTEEGNIQVRFEGKTAEEVI